MQWKLEILANRDGNFLKIQGCAPSLMSSGRWFYFISLLASRVRTQTTPAHQHKVRKTLWCAVMHIDGAGLWGRKSIPFRDGNGQTATETRWGHCMTQIRSLVSANWRNLVIVIKDQSLGHLSKIFINSINKKLTVVCKHGDRSVLCGDLTTFWRSRLY